MKQKTESRLCEAFVELLRKYSFSKITIQMLTNYCKVNRQTFYYHYDNIYDLMASAFEQEISRDGFFDEGASWDECMYHSLCWMRKNRTIVKNLFNNVDVRYMRRAIYPVIARCMENTRNTAIQTYNLSESMEEEIINRFVIMGVNQYILEWIESDFRDPEEDIIDNVRIILKRVYRIEE